MSAPLRFGRKMPAASTFQVRREFTSYFADEHARELCAEAEGLPATATWEEICAHRATVATTKD
jgi:hypothetical protein